MKKEQYRIPNLSKRAFARTNVQTIGHRLGVMQEMMPDVESIGEICCGDCLAQHEAYQSLPRLKTYRGLDLVPEIAAYNKKRGIDCLSGSALDSEIMKNFCDCDILFFGPPLSEDCDGHRLLSFEQVRPDYLSFASLMFGELAFEGIVVAICPNQTSMGDIGWLNSALKKNMLAKRKNVNLSLIHHTHTTLTGSGETTGLRLKYIELWFSSHHCENWEIRHSGLEPE